MLAILVVFGQTAGFGFVNFDDDKYVYENPVVENGLTLKGALWVLTYGEIGHWHPLTWLTHMADCQIYGVWPGGHHLTNVALHAVATALLFIVLRKMTGSLWQSAVVAAVFAIHPLRAESVAWISERKDVLSGMFFMLTLWAYVLYARQPSVGRYVLVAVMYGLGLLSKNMLVTRPFVLLLLDWWPLGRMKPAQARIGKPSSPGLDVPFWRLVKEKIPLLFLSAGSCVATACVSERIRELDRHPVLERVGNAVVSYVIYLRQMVFPAGLAASYPFPRKSPSIWAVCAAVAVLAGVTAGVVACRKKRPFLLVGWLWYLGMLVPAIGIVQISYYAHADRYTYLPGIGLAIAGTWAVTDVSAGWKHRRWILGVLTLSALGAWAVCGRIQTSYWKGSESLWTHTLACTSNNFEAHLGLGDFLRQQGRLDEAIVQYRKALEIEPDDVRTLNNLGNVLGLKGQDQAALAPLQKALKIQPGFAGTRVNLGNLFLHGKPDEAIAQYRKALEIEPRNAEIHYNLGRALGLTGATDAAIAEYEKALEIRPDYADAHFNLGNRFLKAGKLDEASRHFRGAVDINPFDTAARNNLGRVLLLKGDSDGAMACFMKTTDMSPDPLARWLNLANSFLRQELLEEAILCCRQASQLSGGGNPLVLRVLAGAYAKQGHYGQAAATARSALALAMEQKMAPLSTALQKEIKLYEANTPPRNAPP